MNSIRVIVFANWQNSDNDQGSPVFHSCIQRKIASLNACGKWDPHTLGYALLLEDFHHEILGKNIRYLVVWPPGQAAIRLDVGIVSHPIDFLHQGGKALISWLNVLIL